MPKNVHYFKVHFIYYKLQLCSIDHVHYTPYINNEINFHIQLKSLTNSRPKIGSNGFLIWVS